MSEAEQDAATMLDLIQTARELNAGTMVLTSMDNDGAVLGGAIILAGSPAFNRYLIDFVQREQDRFEEMGEAEYRALIGETDD